MATTDSPHYEDDDVDDPEWSEPDLWDDDDSEVLPCPECGEQIYEFTDQCPHCHQYIYFSTQADNVFSGRSFWWILLASLGIIGFLFTLWNVI